MAIVIYTLFNCYLNPVYTYVRIRTNCILWLSSLHSLKVAYRRKNIANKLSGFVFHSVFSLT